MKKAKKNTAFDLKTRDVQWFDSEHKTLASRKQSWGTDEMYQRKLHYLQWCFDRMSISQNASILDVGCGAGELAFLLNSFGFSHVDGVDISHTAIHQAKSKNSGFFTVRDFAEPCKLSQNYDCIFDTDCLHMIIALQKRQVFLANVRSHLKKEGIFLTGINSIKPGVNPHIVVDEHIQYFWPSCNEYINEVCNAGFYVLMSRNFPPRNKVKCDKWVEIAFRKTD